MIAPELVVKVPNPVLGRAVIKFGAEAQTRKAAEECVELSLELLHALDGRANMDKIAEEMADVEIMLAQMRLIYGSADVDAWKEKKINALALKIEAV